MLNRRQLLEWMAYYKVQPWGYERTEYGQALQTFHLLRGWVGEIDQEPKDFMPAYENGVAKSEAEQIVDEILESL